MSSLARSYVTEVHEEYRYWPSWLPLPRYKIGDCGTLEDGVFFTKKRHVTRFGVSKDALKEEPAERADPMLRFHSKGAVSIEAQARGENARIPNIPSGEVGARITFSRENATLLAARGVKDRRLVDQYRLEQELKDLVKAGDFPPDHVVVTDLVVASSARVMISTSANQSVTFTASASAKAATFDIAALGGKISGSLSHTGVAEYQGGRGTTPLFKVMGFNVGGKMRRFKEWVFQQGKGVPRIVVGPIEAKPEVGRQITIRPVDGRPLAVSDRGGESFLIRPSAWTSFRAEPILTETSSLGALLHTPASEADETNVWGTHQGVLLGSFEAQPAVGEALAVHPLENSPVLIQPIDQEPFLVKLVGEEALNFEPSELTPLDVPYVPGELEPGGEDPLHFGYVDFDAELAAADANRD